MTAWRHVLVSFAVTDGKEPIGGRAAVQPGKTPAHRSDVDAWWSE